MELRDKEMWCGTERQQQQLNGHGQSHIQVWRIKIGRDTLGTSDPSPRPAEPRAPAPRK